MSPSQLIRAASAGQPWSSSGSSCSSGRWIFEEIIGAVEVTEGEAPFQLVAEYAG
jgi:hypothetical protein